MTEPALGIEKAEPAYDASAPNRFEFKVTDDGQVFDTAHVFKPLSDERYLQWVGELKLRSAGDELDENARAASIALWNDLIERVENIDTEGIDGSWKDLIPDQEKIDSLNELLAIAIVDDEAKPTTGVRKLGTLAQTQTVFTEAYFNGQIVRQSHKMVKRSLEFEKKHNRIQQRRFKQEQTRGLRRKAKVEYVPQDEAIGKLYDEMVVSVSGFAGDVVPLRFKNVVIAALFAPVLDPKK